MHRRSALGAGVSLVVGAALPTLARAEDPVSAERVKVFWGPNHGHELAIPIEDLRAKAEKTYTVVGKSDHAHVFTVKPADWDELVAGRAVRLASTKTGGHLHRVRLTGVPAVERPDDVSACDVEIGGTDGHELVVPESHVLAKAERVYDIQGAAPHTHQVKITPAQFEKIAKGEQVLVSASAGDAHTHLVAIRKKKA